MLYIIFTLSIISIGQICTYYVMTLTDNPVPLMRSGVIFEFSRAKKEKKKKRCKSNFETLQRLCR